MTTVEILKTVYKVEGYPGLLQTMSLNDYGCLTLVEIAEILGIPVGRVQKISQQAIRKLRNPKIGKKFLDYMRLEAKTEILNELYEKEP